MQALGNATYNDDERIEEQELNEVLAAAISRKRALSARTNKDVRTLKYDVQGRINSLISVPF